MLHLIAAKHRALEAAYNIRLEAAGNLQVSGILISNEVKRKKCSDSRADHARTYGVEIKYLEEEQNWGLDIMVAALDRALRAGSDRYGKPFLSKDDVSVDVMNPFGKPGFNMDFIANHEWVSLRYTNNPKGDRTISEYVEAEKAKRVKQMTLFE